MFVCIGLAHSMLLVHRAHKHTKLWMEEKQHYDMMLCFVYALQRSVRFFCRPAFYFPAHRTGTLHDVGAQGTQTHKFMDGRKKALQYDAVLCLCIAKECEIFLQLTSNTKASSRRSKRLPRSARLNRFILW